MSTADTAEIKNGTRYPGVSPYIILAADFGAKQGMLWLVVILCLVFGGRPWLAMQMENSKVITSAEAEERTASAEAIKAAAVGLSEMTSQMRLMAEHVEILEDVPMEHARTDSKIDKVAEQMNLVSEVLQRLMASLTAKNLPASATTGPT